MKPSSEPNQEYGGYLSIDPCCPKTLCLKSGAFRFLFVNRLSHTPTICWDDSLGDAHGSSTRLHVVASSAEIRLEPPRELMGRPTLVTISLSPQLYTRSQT